jgi:hypothetical protein
MLVTAGLFTQVSDITPAKLAVMQWMNPELLTNSAAIAALNPNFKQYKSMF